jgi:hypothetical protein
MVHPAGKAELLSNPAGLRQNLAVMKTTSEPLYYTEAEIRSFLPTGWDLLGDPHGAWDAKKQIWHATVIDNVDFDWPVEVKAGEAGRLGRLEAIRQAFDELYRERLG